MELSAILALSMQRNASDIILTVGRPPMFRINGSLVPDTSAVLSSEDTEKLIFSVLNDSQVKEFNEKNELDLAVFFPDSGRFRVNVFRQQNFVGAAFRPILSKIPTFESLALSQTISNFCNMPSGLICVTGPTGSGKSTTLAAMINHINMHRQSHIITIEDPIEFVHSHIRSVIEQREVGKDTETYTTALKYVLRQCPDVILIGEMRDLETIAAAITIAETGHLVFATLHTQSAAKTIDRIIDVFPPYQQQQIRAQLASTLKGVVSQILLPRKDGMGRVAAREIMVVTPGISNLIREGKVFQIPTALQTGASVGMISMDQSLLQLKNAGVISEEVYQTRVTPKLGAAPYGN
ncbi:MAG: Twitching mobility protein [bacterium ADurb.Bin157]|jgi:twitching motility protein PilT|nr:type IV pilus twitching motility protein PilT [Candidatus Riflebacteria bacterium]NCB46101.1 type IV pilus twitching motility protein PilT [bacterium]OQB50325.1 MAG: Twitching mobility protein [bacterium ADurb.Bin157]MDD2623853.1 type IV pilus twitching motility protein PilT [Candidatus Riflebacteria bacterium]MDD3377130.1 type IV pilus twitching motility protein PilT [Candidatus Riflebacteria bacterium]